APDACCTGDRDSGNRHNRHTRRHPGRHPSCPRIRPRRPRPRRYRRSCRPAHCAHRHTGRLAPRRPLSPPLPSLRYIQAATHPPAPHLDRPSPIAAIPGGQIHVHGQHHDSHRAHIPRATIGDIAAPVTLSRPTRASVHIPEGTITGNLILHRSATESNPLHLRVAVPMSENLHPVANPAVDANGNVYTTFSGERGQAVPVSIFQIQRDFQIRPFVRNILN